jgi:hypothetical protein
MTEGAPDPDTPWTPAVLDLLRDWQRRAAASAEANYSVAQRLAKHNIRLGIPVVALTTLIGTSVFATLEENVAVEWRIIIGVLSALAAVLASLQTFLRFPERAEKHRAAGEQWSAVRREIAQMLALHPTYLASRGDPKSYLDDLRRRMDEIASQSPEMPDRDWARARRAGTASSSRASPPLRSPSRPRPPDRDRPGRRRGAEPPWLPTGAASPIRAARSAPTHRRRRRRGTRAHGRLAPLRRR